MNHFFDHLNHDLQARRESQLYRSRPLVDSPAGPEVVVDGQKLLSFCSNDYLGLANHPDIKQAFIKGVNQWGVGSGSAHLVAGHSRAHHELEEELAEYTGRQRALYFASGYMANQGVITALLGSNDTLLEDRLNHASLIDAGQLSAARMLRYQHADMESLQKQVSRVETGEKLVVTDGVFSMDGDIAPLKPMAELCKQQNALLMVDDAHGIGVLGEQGRGSVNQAGLDANDVQIVMGTLGKAFGCSGAFVAGDEVLIETLIQRARSYIYTTASPPALAEATRAALKLVIKEDWRRDRLHELILAFRKGAKQIGLSLMDSKTPIQPIVLGDSAKALAFSQALHEKGFLITAIRPPTVPEGTARLRLTLSAEHSDEQLEKLLLALEKVHRELT